jgi:hypothetical protein
MLTFTQWCEEKQLDLPVVTDVEDAKKTKEENRVRTGLRPAYPDAYYRSQYPDLYSTPHSATAALDLQNSKKISHKNG